MTTALQPGPFTPANDDMTDTYYGVGVTEFDNGTAVALTDDKRRAIAAINRHLRETTGKTLLDANDVTGGHAVFRRPPAGDECSWYVDNANEGDEHAVVVAWLEA